MCISTRYHWPCTFSGTSKFLLSVVSPCIPCFHPLTLTQYKQQMNVLVLIVLSSTVFSSLALH